MLSHLHTHSVKVSQCSVLFQLDPLIAHQWQEAQSYPALEQVGQLAYVNPEQG